MTWPEVVCWVGARLAEALDYAHSQGVLHRDVKPANVLLDPHGNPKLVDFNVSFSSKQDGVSAKTFFGGSIAYMSPEQLEAFDPKNDRDPESLDGRCDLFSLSVMLWELLCGERPFHDEFLLESWPGVLSRVVEERKKGLTEQDMETLPGDCPPALREALLACLKVNPDERPADGKDLASRLEVGLNPRAERLLHPPKESWRASMARHPVVWLVVIGLVPNLLTAIFNLAYNSREIVTNLTPDGEAAFWVVQGLVNGVAFPVGIGTFIWRCRPVRRALVTGEAIGQGRRRLLRLGHDVALISLAGWLTAGIAYPTTLWLSSGPLSAGSVLHFVISLALCGLMAVTYTFFAMAFVGSRSFYPALMRKGGATEGEAAGVARLGSATWLYLLLAAAVPLIALTSLALIESKSQLALIGLSAGGLAGVGLAFWMCREIQGDLGALAGVLRR